MVFEVILFGGSVGFSNIATYVAIVIPVNEDSSLQPLCILFLPYCASYKVQHAELKW